MTSSHDWFNNKLSNVELAAVLGNYSNGINGTRVELSPRIGRCTLARQLEALDRQVANRKTHVV